MFLISQDLSKNVSLFCSIFVLLHGGYLIYLHLKHLHEPRYQLAILKIILLVPCFSITTYLALVLPESSLIFDALRECCSAYTLYLFFLILLQWLGGDHTIISHFELQGRVPHLWPLSKRFRPLSLNRHFFRKIKNGVLQFVLIKPITAVLALILQAEKVYEEGEISFKSGYLYCAIINNISVSISVYCLGLFYKATKDRLEAFKPYWKFLVIKAMIYFSFWQSTLLLILLKMKAFGDPKLESSKKLAYFYQDYLLSLETVLFSVVFYYAFSYKEFADLSKSPKPIFAHLESVLNYRDLILEARESFSSIDDEDYERPMKEIKQRKTFKNHGEEDDEDEHGHFIRTK